MLKPWRKTNVSFGPMAETHSPTELRLSVWRSLARTDVRLTVFSRVLVAGTMIRVETSRTIEQQNEAAQRALEDLFIVHDCGK